MTTESPLQVVLLDDEEIEAIRNGEIWTSTDGRGAAIVAHEDREGEIVDAIHEIQARQNGGGRP